MLKDDCIVRGYMANKEIWVPTTEVKVKIDIYGVMTTWEEMTMKPRPITQKITGFQYEEKEN